MRLTSVARMGTRAGRVTSLPFIALPLDGPVASEERLTISFDQARHVGLGPRPGSWMAVALSLPESATRQQIAEAWCAVVARHQTLRTVFLRDGPDAELILTEVDVVPGDWLPLTDGEVGADEVREVLRRHFDEVCEPFARPSHRLCLVEAPDRPPQIVVGADHSHVDAWSLLLARDLTACLADVVAGRSSIGGDLPAAEPFSAHTAMLEARTDPPSEVVSRWGEILRAGGDAMPTFPLPLGDLSSPRDQVMQVCDVVDAEELGLLEAYASDHGVRLLSVAISALTRLSLDGAGQPLRAVFPVHNREDRRWFDSVGWFITNAVLENGDPSLESAHRAVRESIRLGSTPLTPIMRPYGGMPAAPGMFAMSWLDQRRLPVAVDERLDTQHVSAVIRTDGVMIWFVVNGRGLHLRCRYPDTEEARSTVPTWLADVVTEMRSPMKG
ncbi:peptide synthetase [Nesterenkonia marinintestina]|uniref:peptide synthetase n=1 Tax=Nesterenkonia marinintestina TaxID=2979865 RepID=UPI0021C23CEF|nr:peptide synthetase [Nesterenkonia sp. GX14115]